jgi:hypothetical protein
MTTDAAESWESPEVAKLLAQGRELGCVSMSELDRLAEELDLGSDDVDALHARLRAQEIEVRDDCGQERTPDNLRATETTRRRFDVTMRSFAARSPRSMRLASSTSSSGVSSACCPTSLRNCCSASVV